MLKQFIKPTIIKVKMTKLKNNYLSILGLSLLIFMGKAFALDSDKEADFLLEGDNFKNLPVVEDGMTQIKYWGNISIQQGTLKIKSDEAIIFNTKEGISKVHLTGTPVTMEQFVDVEFGKIEVVANDIDFRVTEDLLYMTGDVTIKSKIQGEMHGEKITMNLKTKEIKGEKSENQRVKLIIKSKNKKN